MTGPGVPRGQHRSQLVANVDLAPTIVDLADLHPTRTLDGRSLLPLLGDPGLERGTPVLLERGQQSQRKLAYEGVRTLSFKYVEYRTGERELYDLASDPDELENRRRPHARPGAAGPRVARRAPQRAPGPHARRRRRSSSRSTTRAAGPVRRLDNCARPCRARTRRSSPRWTCSEPPVDRRTQAKPLAPGLAALVDARAAKLGVRVRATLIDGRVKTLDRSARQLQARALVPQKPQQSAAELERRGRGGVVAPEQAERAGVAQPQRAQLTWSVLNTESICALW